MSAAGIVASVCALLSGVCGLAHEVLYARILTTYLGNMFYVDAAVLATFLAGIGVGAALAKRVRSLWWCEAAVGAYGLAAAAFLALLSTDALETLAPLGAGGPVRAICCVVGVALPPALLIGTAIPWLSARVAEDNRGRDAFARVYGLYNVGAALCVLLLELVLLPRIGMRASLALVASVNVLDAALLFVFLRRARHGLPAPAAVVPEDDRAFERVRERVLLALFALSAVSGLSQLFVLKTVEALVGPYQRNFALLLAGTLVGLALGTRVVRGLSAPPSLSTVALFAALACAAVFSLVEPLALLRALLAERATPMWLVEIIIVGPLAIIPAAAFGASVPALVRTGPRADGPVHGGRFNSGGRLLLVSSLGNVAGYLLAMWIIWERAPDALLATSIPLAAALVSLAVAERSTRTWAIIVAALALVPSALWPTDALRIGNMAVTSRAAFHIARAGGLAVRGERRYGTEAVLVRDAAGDDTLVLDGYLSMRVSKGGRTNRAELLVGTAPAALTAGRARAMVIGLGTGISAGAVASVFEHTRVVELSPAMLAVAPLLAAHSLGLAERPGVEIVLADGISALAADEQRYDLILNTVNAPRFFASSKLYSEDFMALARRRLAPGGVYATWLDASAGTEGVDTILRTLHAVFPACAYVSLKGAYAEIVCGDTLTPRVQPESEWPPELVAALGPDVSALVRAALFVNTRLDVPAGPLHTLDRPVLEHIDEPSLREVLRTPWDAMAPALDIAVDGSVLDAAAIARRCELLRDLSDPAPKGCRAPP